MTNMFHHVELRFIFLFSAKGKEKMKKKLQVTCVTAFCEGLGAMDEVI